MTLRLEPLPLAEEHRPACRSCAAPLYPFRDPAHDVAIVRAVSPGDAAPVRFECKTSSCPDYGRRLSLDEWRGSVRVERPTWDEQFLAMAELVARRGTCDRAKVGCVLVVANRVVSTGYNGSLPGTPHCDDVGHLMREASCIRTVHAEANAVADAARRGVSLDTCTAYLTRTPCLTCAQLLISAGCRRVVCVVPYRDPSTVQWLFDAAGVRLDFPPPARGV